VKFLAVAVPVDTMMALAKRRLNTRERNINLLSKVSEMPSRNPEEEMLESRQAANRELNTHHPPPVVNRVPRAVTLVET
jgi:hypothetical protein